MSSASFFLATLAGGLEFGETLSGAAARETQEEVGISTKMLTLSPSMYVWM
jgi:NADH pyrophosphatase NudC (nudix superfamily)